MTLSPTQRAAVQSIALATLLSLLLNSAPHGELLAFERLCWIALSLLLYSSAVVFCFAIPAHLLLRRLGATNLIYYLATGVSVTCIAYTILYRYVNGEFWLGGMFVPMIYNVLVGLLIAPCFYYVAYANGRDKRPQGIR